MLTRRTALITALLLASTFALFLNADFLSRYARSPLAVPVSSEFGKAPPMPGGQGGAVVNPDGGAVAVSEEGDGGGGLAVANGGGKEEEKKEGDGGLGALGGDKDAGLGALDGNKDAGLGALGGNKDAGLGALDGNKDAGLGALDGNKDAGLGALDGNKDAGLGALDGLGGDNKDAGLGAFGGIGDNDNTKKPVDAALPVTPPGNENAAAALPAFPAPTDNTNPAAPAGDNADKLVYFEQAFSAAPPAPYDFPALKAECARTKWREDDVYLHCGGMAAGLTSIMSQVKVCLKMAFDAGTGIVLPSMPLRDSDHLKEFNMMNQDAYMTYDEWFDVAHLMDSVKRVCPQMKIVHPSQLDTPEHPVKHRWSIKLEDAKGYKQFQSYFWAGRPFATFFNDQYIRLKQLETMNPNNKQVDDTNAPKGMTVVKMSSNFLLFRITDDPTGQDLRLWNDLSHLIRFPQATRDLVAALMTHINKPFYGVHFRVEADTIWSSLEHQLKVDLDALDKAWEMFGTPGAEKPLVYLACGDQEQVKKFVEAGAARGWTVTHKWTLAAGDQATLDKIDALPFDFQGAVDMGFMVKSDFFLGITGSAFSSTIGNARDVTGRYRGSSLLLGKEGDGGARTHLFNDGDASHYACCL